MKKLLIVLILFFLSFQPVFADVLIEPWEDEFYREHPDEMIVEYHYYKTLENVQIMESPISDTVKGTVETGRIIRVEFLYTDENGTLWGMQVLKNDKGAWFQMKHLERCKEHSDFMNEHPELTKIEKTRVFDGDGWIALWEYPGSEMIVDSIEANKTTDESSLPIITYEYTDESGNLWVYVPYFDHSSGWINTSEPNYENNPSHFMSTKMNPDGSPVSTSSPALDTTPDPDTTLDSDIQVPVDDGSLDEYVSEDSKEPLIAGLVTGVCVLTGVLAYVQYRKKRNDYD